MGCTAKQVLITLKDDAIRLKPGAMQMMLGNVSQDTGVKSAGDFIGKALKAKVTGDNAIKPVYRGTGQVLTEPTFAFPIIVNTDEWGGAIVCDDGMFICCDDELKDKVVVRGDIGTAIASGEGLFNLSLEGSGYAVLSSACPMKELYEINLENYSKTINIEALTMIEMVRKDILPAVSTYIRKLSEAAASTKTICPEIACTYEIDMVKKLSFLADTMYQRLGELDRVTAEAATITDGQQNADYFGDTVLSAMQSLREVADEIETLVGEKYWLYPTYGKLLFNV